MTNITCHTQMKCHSQLVMNQIVINKAAKSTFSDGLENHPDEKVPVTVFQPSENPSEDRIWEDKINGTDMIFF